jgi:hypothetical protein
MARPWGRRGKICGLRCPDIQREGATIMLERALARGEDRQLREKDGGSASAARPGTAMRKRSRRPDLVSPSAVDFFAYPLQIG